MKALKERIAATKVNRPPNFDDLKDYMAARKAADPTDVIEAEKLIILAQLADVDADTLFAFLDGKPIDVMAFKRISEVMLGEDCPTVVTLAR